MDRRGLTLRQGPIDESLYRSASSSAVESTSYLPPTIATSADSLNREFKLHVGRFFYENGLDFDAASSTSFKSMISLFSRRGIQCQAPTVEELKGWIFRDVMKEATSRVDEIKRSWAVTGCSILLDGWTYANDRTFVNVLADSPKGTVYLSSSDITDCVGNMEAMQTFLAKVGLHNVVQIVTYSSSAFMMERYRPIFWTVTSLTAMVYRSHFQIMYRSVSYVV